MGGPGHSDHSEGSEQSEGVEKAGSDGSEGSEASEKTGETCSWQHLQQLTAKDDVIHTFIKHHHNASPLQVFDF